jgi:hypothetical protein
MDPKGPETNADGHKRTADELVEIVYDDGPGDTTVRPAGPEIPRDWPRPQLPPRTRPSNGEE